MEDFSDKGSGVSKLPPDCISINIKDLVNERVNDLKDIINARFKAIEDKIKYQADSSKSALDKAFESAQLAISKVEIGTNSKFESHNEFRLQLKEQVSTFATRKEFDTLRELVGEKMSKSEYENRHVTLESKIEIVSQKMGLYYSKTEMNEVIKTYTDECKKVSDRQWVLAFFIITALIGVAFDFITRR
jgi:hypothetical protein